MTRKSRELTPTEQNTVMKLYDSGMKKGDICRVVHIDYTALKNFFDTHDMPNQELGIPKSERPKIFELYNSGFTLQQIHNEYYPQYSVNQINHICRKQGITRPNGKQAHFNKHYFDKIDTPDKAYWLGLLTADGCITNYHNRWVTNLSLMKEDKALVERFALDVETNLSVKEYTNNTGFQRQDGGLHQECRISLCSEEFARNLEKYGIVPQKSLRLTKVPELPNCLYRHYIRGFFDGNGSVTYYWNKTKNYRCPRIIFYSTHSFCEDLMRVICTQLEIPYHTITDQKQEQMSLFSYTLYEHIEKIYQYLYNDLSDDFHYLKRKQKKLDELMSEYRDNQTD